MISCCGIRLPALEAEAADPAHSVKVERVEDEIFVSADHPMSKEHYLSFIAYMTATSTACSCRRCKHDITENQNNSGAEGGSFRSAVASFFSPDVL